MIYQFVVSFILGIVFEKIFNFGWPIALLVCIVSLAIFFYLSNKNQKQTLPALGHKGLGSWQSCFLIFVVGLAFCLGILRMSFVDTSPDENFSKLVGQKISFEATISEEPDVRDDSTRYTIRPNNSKSLVLLIADRFPQLVYGDKISVSGKLDVPKNFQNNNGTEFDYISYLSKNQIHFLIYRPEIKKITSPSSFSIISYLYSIKNIFIEKISAVVPEPNSSLLGGVIFGAKQSLGQNLLDDFKKVGLIHIVVLSGYNITIIAIGIFWFLSFWGKRNLSFILSAIFIVLFAIMVGLGATVIRACIMALIAILARFLGRPADALRWLFIAGFLMLVWNPLILFYDPSFQLSFMATLGLILFSPFIFNFISNHKISKFIPTKFGLREIVASTLAVQFFVLPLLIRMSGFVSIISFVVNPIVLPFVPYAMGLGALTGALGIIPFIGQFLSWPFGVLSYFLTQIIISITELSANIPFATLSISSLPLFAIFIWYAGYGILYWRLTSPRFPSESRPSPFEGEGKEMESKYFIIEE